MPPIQPLSQPHLNNPNKKLRSNALPVFVRTALTGQPPAASMPIDDAQEATLPKITPNDLRSRKWFNNPEMTALYLERYLNYGLPRD